MDSITKVLTPTNEVSLEYTPPFKRLENGMIEGFEYKRLPNKRIDWKAMINPAHIVFNRLKDAEILATYGATSEALVYSEVIKTKVVNEKHILILLQGFVELADLRGYEYCESKVAHVEIDRGVTSTCHITWIPNDEDPTGKTSSGVADATSGNTSGWGYLATMADNRAFVRAVKRGLGIQILGFDEIAAKDNPAPEVSTESAQINPLMPQGVLKRIAEENNLTFIQLKAGATSKYRKKISGDPEKWEGFESVSPQDCMTLVGVIKESKATGSK